MKKKEKKPVNREGWKTTKKERINYYIGDIGRTLEGYIVTAFMTLFLLFQGINLVKISAAILVVKIIDACDDVVFGFLVDKLNIKNSKIFGKLAGEGRYLPWYRATFFLFPIFTVLFFLMPQSASETVKIIWFMITYLLYDLTYTLVEVPMNSMIVSLTDNAEERDSILQLKGIMSAIATVLAGIIWMTLVSEHVGLSMRMVAIVSSVIFFIMMLPLATSVKEHNVELKNTEEEGSAEHYTFRDMIECVKTNRYMFVILLSTLIYGALQTGSSLGTYASYYLYGDSLILIIPIALAFIPQTIAQLNTTKLTNKFGKKKVYMIGALSGAFIYAMIYFVGYHYFTLITILLVLQAVPGNVGVIAKSFLTPDTIEYTRYKTGKDCSGIFFSLNAFINKLTTSISASLGLFILGLSDWVAVEAESFEELAALNVQQPQSALNLLWIVYMLIPALGQIVAIAVMGFYKLDDKDAQLMAKCNAGEITREECESLLSRKY
ncbi:MAG: MFS transporter [Erysipelotrichaceae bacterium]|nr:MFS transporter [Erysipelotrichaceae bacterium]MBQ4457321.1 MFS transporter [Clostridia bacterium]